MLVLSAQQRHLSRFALFYRTLQALETSVVIFPQRVFNGAGSTARFILMNSDFRLQEDIVLFVALIFGKNVDPLT